MKIEVSNGELIDKICILVIKLNHIKRKEESEKWNNVNREFEKIGYKMHEIGITEEHELYERLFEVNLKLWDIEDKIRFKEKYKEFDQEFIDLARSVYVMNDKRAKIKKEINLITKSDLVEEKSYETY